MMPLTIVIDDVEFTGVNIGKTINDAGQVEAAISMTAQLLSGDQEFALREVRFDWQTDFTATERNQIKAFLANLRTKAKAKLGI